MNLACAAEDIPISWRPDHSLVRPVPASYGRESHPADSFHPSLPIPASSVPGAGHSPAPGRLAHLRKPAARRKPRFAQNRGPLAQSEEPATTTMPARPSENQARAAAHIPGGVLPFCRLILRAMFPTSVSPKGSRTVGEHL